MWVDPESGKTDEEIAEIVWRGLPPDVQARYTAVMAATGRTFEDICQEAHRLFQKDLAEAEADPTSDFAQECDRMAFP